MAIFRTPANIKIEVISTLTHAGTVAASAIGITSIVTVVPAVINIIFNTYHRSTRGSLVEMTVWGGTP